MKKIVGKVYYSDIREQGENTFDENNPSKKRRPYYILQGLNNEYYFGVKATKQNTSASKRKHDITIKYVEIYIKGSKTNLRLEHNKGWHFFKKNYIQEDFTNVTDEVKISNENKDKLLKFYKETINDEKKRQANEK